MHSFQQKAVLFIVVSTIIRLFLGFQLELGNDEVYYWLYAKYPDISHFDHPPMVGFFIQAFTLNLYLDSEIFIRLAAIIPASLSMIVIFLIGKNIQNSKVGFISVILYNLSIYGFIISGTFILPDSPLVLFWMLSIYFFIKTIRLDSKKGHDWNLLLAFLFTGLAIYSKYQGIYLLIGAVSYALVHNREWFKNIYFYLGLLFPIIAIFLIIYWNYSHEFISFDFHNDRVSPLSLNFNKDSFLREIVGQILYNNPYVFAVVIFMLVSFFRRKFTFHYSTIQLLFFCSLPLIGTTIFLSLTRNTLPHWSGVSYLTLIPLAAVYISKKRSIVKKLKLGFSFLTLILVLASFSINQGYFLPVDSTLTPVERIGKKDFTMDMYGWEILKDSIKLKIKEHQLEGLQLISPKWFPAAHLDYYVARPLGLELQALGDMKQIHKYYWINMTKQPLKNKVLYITDSRNYKNPAIFVDHYPSYLSLDTIPITRGGRTVKNAFLYVLQK